MEDYERYDGLGLAELVARGECSAAELIEAAIARTEQRDPAIGAVVIPMFEAARAAAQAGPANAAAPFGGVPFLLKDLHLALPGVRLCNGSQLFADHIPEVESELVARYRRAGLIIFGKSHSPELGLTTTTESRLFGQTRNPWNPAHTAGGSSGGAAAAVAAGLLPLANASDGGGSIRIPASCCGLFGLKPTRGRTPHGPLSGEGWSGMSTVHAITRSVRDSAALLDATAGPDAGAPYAAQPPQRPWLEEVPRAPGRLVIAMREETWNGAPVHPDCSEALRDAAALCEELGHEIVPAQGHFDAEALRSASLTIIGTQTRALLEARAAALGRALQQDDVEPGTWAVAEIGAARSATDYARALNTIHAAGREMAASFSACDLLLTPTMAAPPARLGVLSLSNPDGNAQNAALQQAIGFTQLINITGNPAMSVPLWWTGAGLPIGVQFTAPLDDEAQLFRLAGQLEAARPWAERRPAPAA